MHGNKLTAAKDINFVLEHKLIPWILSIDLKEFLMLNFDNLNEGAQQYEITTLNGTSRYKVMMN